MKIEDNTEYDEEIVTFFDKDGKITEDPDKGVTGIIARFKNGKLVEEMQGDVVHEQK